jgi:hypothetical protein
MQGFFPSRPLQSRKGQRLRLPFLRVGRHNSTFQLFSFHVPRHFPRSHFYPAVDYMTAMGKLREARQTGNGPPPKKPPVR